MLLRASGWFCKNDNLARRIAASWAAPTRLSGPGVNESKLAALLRHLLVVPSSYTLLSEDFMTSFLRTRKDRHPRSESKTHLQQEPIQSDDIRRKEHNDNDHLNHVSDAPYRHGDGNSRNKPR